MAISTDLEAAAALAAVTGKKEGEQCSLLSPSTRLEQYSSYHGLTSTQASCNGDSPFTSSLAGKRILLATESLGQLNGVSRTTLSLVEHLSSLGAYVAVLAPAMRGTCVHSACVELRLSGRSLPYCPDLSVVYPFRLDRIFKRAFKPDIVYLASPASLGFQVLLQLQQLRNPPVVLMNFQTDLSAYSEIIFPPLMDRYAVWLLGVVQGFLFRHSVVQTIFYPSGGIKDYLESINVQSSKLVHLGRGVDTDLFNPIYKDDAYRQELAPNGEIILLSVGRVAPEKGFEFLAKVAMKLDEFSFPFKLVIVGGNKNPSVEAKVQKLFEPIKHKVVFTGFLTGKSLARAYASADTFLHCSITETFGLVVLEAMASGRPVVARNLGGPSEIVQHEKTGYLVDPHDLDTFVDRVRSLHRNTALCSSFSANARQLAIKTTWEKINQTVAWHLSARLQQAETKQELGSQRHGRLLSRFRAWAGSYLYTPWETALISVSVLLASIAWIIAVFPLMLHGNYEF